MNESMPFGFTRSFGITGSAQVVKLPPPFQYERQPTLRFMGSTGVVSFDNAGETLGLCGVSLVSGCSTVRQMGNVLKLEGLACGVPVCVCLGLADGESRQVSFVFRN